MARKFTTPINLGGLELQNPLLQNLASDPGSPAEGQFWYSTTSKRMRYKSDTATIEVGAGLPAMTAGQVIYAVGTVPTAATPDTAGLVATTGAQTVAGIKTFSSFPVTPPSAPSAAYQVTNKQYVDDADALKANLAGPTTFTGVISVPNQAAGDSSAKAANTLYVDSAVSVAAAGFDSKESVRAATTTAGTLATSFENGDTVDGVVLATGNRILIKDQAAGAENGIYTVNATGAPTRATDADASSEVTGGMYVWVNEGTANGDKGFSLVTNDAITLGATALVFTQVTGLGQVTAGTGLTKTGDTIDVIGTANRISVAADAIDISSAYAGQATITTLGTITTGTWNGTTIAILNGGTGSTTAAGARANIAATGKYTQTITGTATTEVITHNLNTRAVVVSVHDVTTFDEVECDVQKTGVNTITLGFAVAPAAGAYVVTVVG